MGNKAMKSVWDYPRPPRVEAYSGLIEGTLQGKARDLGLVGPGDDTSLMQMFWLKWLGIESFGPGLVGGD